jgi:thymidylate synthase (FAD)
MRHRHTTPFESCEIQLYVKMPIFVARQWIRHRTANVNEPSARYSILDKEFYIPEPENIGVQSKDNKQGRAEALTADQAAHVQNLLIEDAERAYPHYQLLLG